jgi:hypothetical protein
MYQYPDNGIAILVFANSPEEELIRKPVAQGAPLFHALTERTLQTVRASGIPYFHYTEKEQTGNSFGERFVNAITSVFDRGFSRVITLGNDSPQLKASDLLRTCNLLSREQFVLGPTADGGCYLLGLHRTHFNLLDLSSLPWQSSGLANEISGRVLGHGISFTRLHTLYDLDTLRDIRLMAARFRNLDIRLWSIIQDLLGQEKGQFQPVIATTYARCCVVLFNKGSPSY